MAYITIEKADNGWVIAHPSRIMEGTELTIITSNEHALEVVKHFLDQAHSPYRLEKMWKSKRDEEKK